MENSLHTWFHAQSLKIHEVCTWPWVTHKLIADEKYMGYPRVVLGCNIFHEICRMWYYNIWDKLFWNHTPAPPKWLSTPNFHNSFHLKWKKNSPELPFLLQILSQPQKTHYTDHDHYGFVIRSSLGSLCLSKTVTDLIYKGKGQTFCRKVNTANVSVRSVFDLSFSKMLTCDTPCPLFSPPLLLSHSSASQTHLPFSLFFLCHCKMQGQRYEKKRKKYYTHLLPGLYLYIILAAPSVHFRE